MPRCQRTFRYLYTGTVTSGSGISQWTCPHCDDHETYTTIRDADLLAYAALAETVCSSDFGPPTDRRRPYLLLHGLRPECVYEPGDRRYDIYLTADADPWQARLQIGHEFFHRIAGEGRIFHWTHEMLACLLSVRLLRQSGLTDYATRMEQQYLSEAESCPITTLLSVDPWADAAYPAGYYGRAFQTGVALKQIVGWPALCRLARATPIPDALPSLVVWRKTLPIEERNAVSELLSGTIEDNFL